MSLLFHDKCVCVLFFCFSLLSLFNNCLSYQGQIERHKNIDSSIGWHFKLAHICNYQCMQISSISFDIVKIKFKLMRNYIKR